MTVEPAFAGTTDHGEFDAFGTQPGPARRGFSRRQQGHVGTGCCLRRMVGTQHRCTRGAGDKQIRRGDETEVDLLAIDAEPRGRIGDHLVAEARHPDVDRVAELLPDRACRQGRRGLSQARIGLDDADLDIRPSAAAQEQRHRRADGAAANDRDAQPASGHRRLSSP